MSSPSRPDPSAPTLMDQALFLPPKVMKVPKHEELVPGGSDRPTMDDLPAPDLRPLLEIHDAVAALTPTERLLARLLIEGYSAEEISAKHLIESGSIRSIERMVQDVRSHLRKLL